jgi:hypothetical protein
VEREEVLQLVVELLRAGGDCEVSVRDGRLRVELRLPAAVPSPAAPPAESPNHQPHPSELNDRERTVLACFSPGETLSGKQVADRLGWAHDGNLRAALAGLRERGLLAGGAGERGYRRVETLPLDTP